MVEDNQENDLSVAEAERYDRQIRLWGMDAQKRLRNAKVLIVGLSGLGAEIAKNTILVGVKSVCLMDHEKLSEVDFYSQFLAPHDKLGKNRALVSLQRAKALNPLVDVTADTTPVNCVSDSYFKKYDIIFASGLKQDQYERINNICRDHKTKFLCGDVWGVFGYMFADLIDHDYTEEYVKHLPVKRSASDDQKTPKEDLRMTVKRRAIYVPLQNALSVDWRRPELRSRLRPRKGDPSYFVMKILLKFRDDEDRDPDPAKRNEDIAVLLKMRDELTKELSLPAGFICDELLHDVFGIVAGTAAILGGVISQEIMKAVSQKEPPYNNMFFFNPIKCSGFVELYGQYETD